MLGTYRYFATSDSQPARSARRLRRMLLNLAVPAPKWIFHPALLLVLGIRAVYEHIMRVFICEPLFKAHCKNYGRNLHTGALLHWVKGPGHIIVGDNVIIDGRCDFLFATRYSEQPVLTIGDQTGIGHGCSFTVGDRITIGQHCRIAGYVQMFDTPGHPADPEARKLGYPAERSDVKPIVIGDNVWIGAKSVIYPGVSIGDNSIVALGSVVMSNVPANVLVAGNPARQIRSLAPAESKAL